jgi:hypothetical protein
MPLVSLIQKNNFNLLVVMKTTDGGISQQVLTCATRADVQIVKSNLQAYNSSRTDMSISVIELFPS